MLAINVPIANLVNAWPRAVLTMASPRMCIYTQVNSTLTTCNTSYQYIGLITRCRPNGT